MNINSFDDVAKHIAYENAKLSDRIVDGFKTELAKVRNDMKVDLQSLSNNLYDAVERVEEEQSNHHTRIARLEDTVARMQRITELVIAGVPVVERESCTDIVAQIGSVINSNVNKDMIRAFRLNKTGSNAMKKRLRNRDINQPPIIIVKFPSTTDKNTFFGKYLAYKNLCLTDIGFAAPNRIFIKENLTPSNYKIFQACEQAKHNGSISKYFKRDGICHISIQPNSKAISIDSLEQFHEIVPTTNKNKRPGKTVRGGGGNKRKKAKIDVAITNTGDRLGQPNRPPEAQSASQKSWSNNYDSGSSSVNANEN